MNMATAKISFTTCERLKTNKSLIQQFNILHPTDKGAQKGDCYDFNNIQIRLGLFNDFIPKKYFKKVLVRNAFFTRENHKNRELDIIRRRHL